MSNCGSRPKKMEAGGVAKKKVPSPIRMPKEIKEKRKAKAAKSRGRDTTGITKAMRDEIGQVKGYKKGGGAFPDLTGDGKVTRKDILKGRGVQGFEGGGAVRGMGCAVSGGKYTGCK